MLATNMLTGVALRDGSEETITCRQSSIRGRADLKDEGCELLRRITGDNSSY